MDNQLLEEKILYKVMRNMPFGMVVSREGLKRKVYYVNEAAYEMLGYTKEEYIEKVEHGWSTFMSVNINQVIREHHDAICKGKEFEVIIKAKKKTGEEVCLLNRIVVKMEDVPVCYMNIIDVTDKMEREQRRQEEHETLMQQATQDSFTKLLNRGTMEKQICAALAHAGAQQECAYIALDVDNFKGINDHYGHGAGDMLILELADILKKYFSRDAYIGRMGGDEFAVFLRNSENHEDIVERANCVMDEMRSLKVGLAMQESPTISMGIAFQMKNETNFENLYNCADAALYQIKNKEKNGIAVAGIC